MNQRIKELDTIISSIDEEASIANARNCLGKYRRLARAAGKPLSDLKSPAITDMPKGGPTKLPDEKIIERLDAREAVLKIEQTLDCMDPINAQIIYLSYMTLTYYTFDGVAMAISMGRTTLKRHKKEALLEFSSYYDNGILLERTINERRQVART